MGNLLYKKCYDNLNDEHIINELKNKNKKLKLKNKKLKNINFIYKISIKKMANCYDNCKNCNCIIKN